MKLFTVVLLCAALALPAVAIDPDHYNDITFVNHVTADKVYVYCYVDNELAGTTFVWNGTVTTTVRDGQHHLDYRVKTADGVEHIVGQKDIVLDYENYTLTMEMQQ